MRRLLVLLALTGGCAGTAGEGQKAAAPAAPSRPPNLVFLFSDDHAAHAISAYGSRLVETPGIDRLAREGALFRNAFCGNSLCAPSRATILTGLHSHAHGVIDNRSVFDGSGETLPRLLQEAGYQTVLLGKWHLKSTPEGFDHYEILQGQGTYYNPVLITPEGRVERTGYTTEILTERALRWLREERDPDRPFLLMVQHKAPHRNWQPGPRELRLFEDREIPEPPTLFDDGAGRASPFREQEMTVARHLFDFDLKLTAPSNLTPEQRALWDEAYAERIASYATLPPEGEERVRWNYQAYLQDYLRCVVGVDRSVAALLDELDRLGLAGQSLVMYSSDQGFFLGDHGFYDKRWMYEESLRMPLLLRWPGHVEPDTEITALVQNIDFAPSLLEAAGVEPPASMHGRSFLPLLSGATPADWRRSLYYHYFEYPEPHRVAPHYGVRTERWKLIHYYDRGEGELFDLEQDPLELHSLYGRPEVAEVQRELEAEIRRLQEQYGERDPERPLEAWHAEFARRRQRKQPTGLAASWPDLQAEADAAPDPSWIPFTVQARVRLQGEDGVVLAHGGGSYGWSLLVRGGLPVPGQRLLRRGQEELAPGPGGPAGRGTGCGGRAAPARGREGGGGPPGALDLEPAGRGPGPGPGHGEHGDRRALACGLSGRGAGDPLRPGARSGRVD